MVGRRSRTPTLRDSLSEPGCPFAAEIYYDREDLECWITSSKRNSTSDPGTNQPP